MGMFNDSSVITRGFGFNQRVLMRGFGKKFDPGGFIPTWRHREYLYDLFAAVLKKDIEIFEIYGLVNFKRDEIVELFSSINKKSLLELDIISPVDSKKLTVILEEL